MEKVIQLVNNDLNKNGYDRKPTVGRFIGNQNLLYK
jgi:hypothetical protein